jgi:hypothetical protein
MLWENGRGSEALILRGLQGPSQADRTTSDRIGERNNQRNEREHHSKSALLLALYLQKNRPDTESSTVEETRKQCR